ncbi:MAG: response regulator [Burkholderiales bacterium]|nr:response regulator [Burkholderiales bacterium]
MKLSKFIILVVDDFPAMRRIIANLLRELGFQNIVEAENGERALHILNNQQIDAVLSDWNMPIMDGLELLKHIRASDKLKNLPVMLVTAEGKRDNVVVAAQAGADSYIVKPFNGQVLQTKIATMLAKRGIVPEEE